MEPQQSTPYKEFITRLGWKVETIDGVNIFLRKFPLMMGNMAKIHRPENLPSTKKLIPLFQKYAIRTLVIEPVARQNKQKLSQWCRTISKHVTISHSPYLPTKTILIDLTPTEENIFRSFSEAKRRAVRRAQKNNLCIKESTNINELIRIKNRSSGFFGFITTTGINKLWPIFAPNHAAILLAYKPENKLIGGVLLIYWDKRAYYWIAGASKEGKKLAAPTLLVWEACKLAKKKKCTKFDFVGVWDERIPKENTSWKGFTKFKEGFGGEKVYYPVFSKRLIPGNLSK